MQDAILADPNRAAVVDLIDIRYWHYREDGSLYAPAGGQNLAPRQHARLVKPGKSSFEQVYRAVRSYREAHPGKAVVYSGDSYDQQAWAVFMAGGSLAAIPAADPGLLASAAGMLPRDSGQAGQYLLGNDRQEYIVYQQAAGPLPAALTKGAKYKVRWFDPKTGKLLQESSARAGAGAQNKVPAGPAVVWISRQ